MYKISGAVTNVAQLVFVSKKFFFRRKRKKVWKLFTFCIDTGRLSICWLHCIGKLERKEMFVVRRTRIPLSFTSKLLIENTLYRRTLRFKSTAIKIKKNQDNSQLSKQLKALESLTSKVKKNIEDSKEFQKREEIIETSVSSTTNDEVDDIEIDAVFNALGISDSPMQDTPLKIEGEKSSVNNNSSGIDIEKTDLTTLFPAPKPYIQLPHSITDVLTPEILSNITQYETAKWDPVIDSLLKAQTDLGHVLSGYDFHTLVLSIPKKQKLDNKGQIVEKLHELALIGGLVDDNAVVVNDLLALCNFLPKEKASILVETLKTDLVFEEDGKDKVGAKAKDNAKDNGKGTEGTKNKLVGNTTTKAILLNHYARMKDLTSVRHYISELSKLPDSENPMKTSPVIYTSIMQMYMRMDNYSLARETFDTMKFLSVSTAPSTRTYTSMILLDTLNNNIEHGISVYEEMIEKNVKPEPESLLALAKGCGARKGMINKGWDYIIQYYEAGYPVDSQVMEIMMYLGYVDGDLPLVRGIWMNICETKTKLSGNIQLPHPKCTKWLFNTYYKMGDVIEKFKNGQKHMPVGLIDPRVRSIRKKILELTNFRFNEDGNGIPPLIPIVEFDGANTKLMLNEAQALWKYLFDIGGDQRYINPSLIEAYLYVIGRYGELKDFESEWNALTVFEGSKEEASKIKIEEPEEETEETDCDENTDTESLTIDKSKRIEYSIDKIPRNDRFYNLCMHISRHQRSLSFAQKIWQERGEYRKSEYFQSLKPETQDDSDFKFARLMMSVLTELGNVGDAYKLVLSSQSRFIWTNYHLKSLISLCERLGYVTFSKELSKVVRRGDKWIRRQQRRKEL